MILVEDSEEIKLDQTLKNLGSQDVSKTQKTNDKKPFSPSETNILLYVLVSMQESVASQTRSGLVLAKEMEQSHGKSQEMVDVMNGLKYLKDGVTIHCGPNGHIYFTQNGHNIDSKDANNEIQSVNMKNQNVSNLKQCLEQVITATQQRASLSSTQINEAIQDSTSSISQIGAILNLISGLTSKIEQI